MIIVQAIYEKGLQKWKNNICYIMAKCGQVIPNISKFILDKTFYGVTRYSQSMYYIYFYEDKTCFMVKTDVETNTSEGWKGTWKTICNDTRIQTHFPTYLSKHPDSPRIQPLEVTTYVSYIQSCYKTFIYKKQFRKSRKAECYKHGFYYKEGKLPIISEFE